MLNNSSVTFLQEKNGVYCGAPDESLAAKVSKTVIYILLFTAALVGNAFVVLIVYKTREMRTTTNYLIASVSVSDVVFAIVTMPATVKFIYAGQNLLVGGFLAQVICKLVSFLQSSSVSISTLSLTLIALDRFFAIITPLKTVITKRLIRILIIIIWFLSFTLNSPVLYTHTVRFDNKTGIVYCEEIWEPLFRTKKAREVYTVYLFVTFYLLPMVIMAFLYTMIVCELWRSGKAMEHRNKVTYKQIHKANKKVLLMFVTVVVVFALFWLPIFIYQFNMYFGSDLCAVPNFVIITGYVFAHATSAINPFIYCIFSENYRKGFGKLLRKCCCVGGYSALGRQRSSSTGVQRLAVELYAM